MLAAPWAGLPRPELWMVTLFFAVRRWTGSRQSFTDQFHRERGLIRNLIDACDDECLSRRVLIERPIGMEDSSRFWSVLMTLDHLRIVNGEFTRVVESLGKEVLPEGKASTAAVKPDPAVTTAIIAEYEDSCDAWLAATAAMPNLKTLIKFSHPWFGPMDGSGWHALAGMHMGIHRTQIERILHEPIRPH